MLCPARDYIPYFSPSETTLTGSGSLSSAPHPCSARSQSVSPVSLAPTLPLHLAVCAVLCRRPSQGSPSVSQSASLGRLLRSSMLRSLPSCSSLGTSCATGPRAAYTPPPKASALCAGTGALLYEYAPAQGYHVVLYFHTAHSPSPWARCPPSLPYSTLGALHGCFSFLFPFSSAHGTAARMRKGQRRNRPRGHGLLAPSLAPQARPRQRLAP